MFSHWFLVPACAGCMAVAAADGQDFTSIQPELFAARHALSNAFTDVDGDGDPDLVVSFADGAIRLYLNEHGSFAEAGEASGLARHGPAIRGLAWGDFDADGDPDLHAGASPAEGDTVRNPVYRNDGGGRFVEVAESLGLAFAGADSRQSSWIDYDNDGDLDLFTSQRESRNRLFRNEGGRFTDASAETGLDDPRKTVGACWFDFDEDGDLDVFLANQEGGTDALWRNDGGRFTDVAPALSLDRPGRTPEEGGVGCTVGDYDNDGHLDLFVATYGDTLLYRNEGGRFREVAADAGLRRNGHYVGASWGDADNDGWVDLYVAGYDDARSRDHLFMNRGGRFEDVLPTDSPLQASDHGVQWADVDGDGDLDVSLTETFPDEGRHRLFRNELPASQASRSLQLRVLDRDGRATRAGAELRLYDADGQLLGTRLVATGDGYGAQGDAPVHFGLAGVDRVTVEATFMTREGRRTQRVEGIHPAEWAGRAFVVREN
jgi:hypothetical protein